MSYNQDALATLVRERLEPVLSRHLSPPDRERLDAEGAALDADAAFALALREP
jgi:hypothetical protein